MVPRVVRLIALLLLEAAASHLVSAFPAGISGAGAGVTATRSAGKGTCAVKRQRKPWQALTDSQRASYINATLCLMSSPPRQGIAGAKSRWDELHYVHVSQSDYIHFTGSFLPWHRYFLRVHETLLGSECGYEGPMPYWNETADVGNVKKSPIFDPHTGFGGDGVGPGPVRCIADGPFSSLVLRWSEDLVATSYCLMRNVNECPFYGAGQANIDKCLAATSFTDAWHCMEARPHSAGHAGVGGIMVNTKLSPGDPIFFLHHAWIDRLWWMWQSQDLAARLVEIAGENTPVSTLPIGLGGTFTPPIDPACFFGTPVPGVPGNGTNATAAASPPPPANPFAGNSPGGGTTFPFTSPSRPFPALTDHFNDGGNVTTLNHVLWSAGLIPNATIADVMDLNGPFVCAEYL